jgi:nucleotide-binding universal stress UspA family protein
MILIFLLLVYFISGQSDRGGILFKKILVPLDGSRLAEKILPRVEKLVVRSKGEVHLIRVVVSYRIDPKEEKGVWPTRS